MNQIALTQITEAQENENMLTEECWNKLPADKRKVLQAILSEIALFPDAFFTDINPATGNIFVFKKDHSFTFIVDLEFGLNHIWKYGVH